VLYTVVCPIAQVEGRIGKLIPETVIVPIVTSLILYVPILYIITVGPNGDGDGVGVTVRDGVGLAPLLELGVRVIVLVTLGVELGTGGVPSSNESIIGLDNEI
jgi:hypothetical protein